MLFRYALGAIAEVFAPYPMQRITLKRERIKPNADRMVRMATTATHRPTRKRVPARHRH